MSQIRRFVFYIITVFEEKSRKGSFVILNMIRSWCTLLNASERTVKIQITQKRNC